MGYSPCRMCDLRTNGYSEMTDGTYAWPVGLVHYIEQHDVRLPDEFVRHAVAESEARERFVRDLNWWGKQQPRFG